MSSDGAVQTDTVPRDECDNWLKGSSEMVNCISRSDRASGGPPDLGYARTKSDWISRASQAVILASDPLPDRNVSITRLDGMSVICIDFAALGKEAGGE